MTVRAKINAIKLRYHEARVKLDKKEAAELTLIRLECEAMGHDWKWHQIAGNGRFCLRCDCVDTDCDD